MTTEELLIHLCQFGLPRLSKHDSGWHARVDMHVSTAGTSFEIKSEFNHATPLSALELVTVRVSETLAYWNKKTANLQIK